LVPVAVDQVYIVGGFCNWSIPTDSTKMKLVDTTPDGKIFTIHLWAADAAKFQYKFVAGPAWDYEQTAGANFIFPKAEASVAEVVSEFKAIYDPTKLGDINMTINVPLGTDSVWIQGSFIGWNFDGKGAGGKLCTKVADGKFSYVVKSVMGMQYRMYNQPSWSYPEVDSLGAERKNREAAYPADANLEITVINWKQKSPYTGINSLKREANTISSKDMSVTVTNVKSQVELFNAAGQRVVSEKVNGTFTSKKLNAGMYIVRVDGVTRKVVIK
jgi:hypothetical protein